MYETLEESFGFLEASARRHRAVEPFQFAQPERIAVHTRLHFEAGTPAGSELLETLSRAAYRECRPLDNVEGDAAWRHEMVPVVVARALRRVGIADSG